MTAVLTRLDSPLAWCRVRLTITGDGPTRMAAGRVVGEALPDLSADGTPLHRRLALLGSVVSVQADGFGVVVYVVAYANQIAPTLRAVSSALHTPLSAGLLADAQERAEGSWRWERNDSEALANLLADLALHTPPAQWSGLADALTAAVPKELQPWSTPASAGTLSTTFAGPHMNDNDALLHGLTSQRESTIPASQSPTPVSHGRWHLNVVSDGSVLIRLGWRAPRRDAEDFAALAVAARIIGGHHRAWLTREFRTKRGWAYAPWTLLRSGPDHGLWQASVRVPHAHMEEAISRTQDLVRTSRPTPDEHRSAVAHARTEVLHQYAAGDTRVSLLGYWQDLDLNPSEEKERWLTELSATTLDDVSRAVSRWLATEPHITMTLG